MRVVKCGLGWKGFFLTGSSSSLILMFTERFSPGSACSPGSKHCYNDKQYVPVCLSAKHTIKISISDWLWKSYQTDWIAGVLPYLSPYFLFNTFSWKMRRIYTVFAGLLWSLNGIECIFTSLQGLLHWVKKLQYLNKIQ